MKSKKQLTALTWSPKALYLYKGTHARRVRNRDSKPTAKKHDSFDQTNNKHDSIVNVEVNESPYATQRNNDRYGLLHFPAPNVN